ncbi:hypothetical protein NP493_865g00018 [Ridgeia piscesae]|uniref:Galaxin-like repeats domain-containing protein n=1 Tax=Ridgeia piscesae TaxID=27915 RepID=A0AAD9NNF8_RIDPI|nr:hypothetical protein NP493_865g00018 [Ridgeia piscesae]
MWIVTFLAVTTCVICGVDGAPDGRRERRRTPGDCGDYDDTVHICCNGLLDIKTSSNDVCCGLFSYNPDVYTCCDDLRYSKGVKNPCEAEEYVGYR